MSTNFYELLGVDPSADQDTIKKAYRRRARELHPDANPDDPSAEERFKEVSRAYEVLSDPDTRQKFVTMGLEVLPMPVKDFNDFTVTEVAKWSKIVKDSGARVD